MAPALAFASTSAAGAATSSSSAAAWSLDLGDDPTDWTLDGFEHLRELDSSLRCELCFGIFVAPVSVKECNHTFCSSCVRETINGGDSTSGGQQCPKCRRKGVFDSQLVPNVALEAASQAWKLARPQLAELQKAEQARRDAAQAGSVPDATPVSSATTPPNRKSPLRSSEPAAIQEDEAESSTSGRVLRSRAAKRPRVEGASSESPYVVPDSDEDEDATWVDGADEGSGSKRGRKAATPQVTPSASPKKSPIKSGDYKNIAPDDMVDCPICSHSFTNIALQRHLDKGGCSPGCPPPSDRERGLASTSSSGFGLSGSQSRNGTKGSAWFSRGGTSASSDSAPPAKLKRPQYELLKDREIVKLLSDARLRTTGVRERLVSRHRHWVNLCNANMDASEKNRKSDKLLRKDMEQWERGADEAERIKKMGGIVNDKKIKGWEEKYKGHFSMLAQVAKAGHRKNVEMHRRKEDGGEDGEASSGAAPPSSLSSAGTMGPPTQALTQQPSSSSDLEATKDGAPQPSSSMPPDATADVTDTDLLDSDALEQELSQA